MTQLDIQLFRRPLRSVKKPLQFVGILAVAMGGDLAAQIYGHFTSPGLFLLPAIAVLGMLGGLVNALLAAGAAVAFVAIVSTQHGQLIHAPWVGLIRLCVMCISAPTVALVVGALHGRTEKMVEGQLNFERTQAALRARTFEAEKAALLSRDQLSQQRANDLIGSISGIVWETSRDGDRLNVAFVSSYAERLLGYPLWKWTASPDFCLNIIHPHDRADAQRQIEMICNREDGSPGNDSVPLEFRWLDQNGRACWVETRLVRLMSGTRCVGFRAVTLDVNQRKELEQALRDRAADLTAVTESLKRSNEELDQFAYITSHDLKAPLRGIFNLSQWIEEDLGDRFTPKAREQMALLRGRVQRMEALINGLLEYSHVGRTRGTTERVDVAALLAEVIDWIGTAPAIQFVIDPSMPVFQADKIRLQQVFSNLLGNAVKHHGTPGGIIHVGCAETAEFYRFSVTDDGQGIESRYHERIFGIFQTLVRRDKLEGTGIGLSLVKKVVESKGGVVEVESEPGHGATFRFTWPKQSQRGVL